LMGTADIKFGPMTSQTERSLIVQAPKSTLIRSRT
jgi:hypothetical protein